MWPGLVVFPILPMALIGVALGPQGTCWDFYVLVFQNRELNHEHTDSDRNRELF